MRRPPPCRIDLRRAFDIYVRGRSRNTDPEEKARRVSSPVDPPDAGAAALESGVRPPARFGVPIPERLDFHRGAGTWRERLAPGHGER
ncbi:MAG: hypothetical protein ACE5JR_00095 [Gemmatimonadota bacterium]